MRHAAVQLHSPLTFSTMPVNDLPVTVTLIPWNSVAFKEVTVFQLLNKFLALYGVSEVHYHARKRPIHPAKLNFSAIHVFAYVSHSHIGTHC